MTDDTGETGIPDLRGSKVPPPCSGWADATRHLQSFPGRLPDLRLASREAPVLDALALMLSPEPGERRQSELLHLKVA